MENKLVEIIHKIFPSHECEALAYLRLRHVGQYSMEPSDSFDIPMSKIQEGKIEKGEAQQTTRSRCKGREGLPLVRSFVRSFVRPSGCPFISFYNYFCILCHTGNIF
jgi:hypothetical protein